MSNLSSFDDDGVMHDYEDLPSRRSCLINAYCTVVCIVALLAVTWIWLDPMILVRTLGAISLVIMFVAWEWSIQKRREEQ